MENQEPKENAKIPDLIRKFLREENLTPGQLASVLNVAETTVHRWLKGEARPTGTAASILWTLIGLGGVALGAGAPGFMGSATLAARLLRGTSVGVGVLTSGVSIYRMLKRRIEQEDLDREVEEELEKSIRAIEEKERQMQRVESLRERLAEEERKLRELEASLQGDLPRDEPSPQSAAQEDGNHADEFSPDHGPEDVRKPVDGT